MNPVTPSTDEWKRLYHWAAKFRDLASWEWMEDDQIFGVQDPAGGEMGYCVVMGSLKEVFGLVVYLGEKGLKGYYQLLKGEISVSQPYSFHQLHCLLASFEDRGDLQQKDRKMIKELGLTFRGKKQWPVFRQYTPGYHPWFLYQGQVRFLTHALAQAVDVSLKMEKNPQFLSQGGEGEILIKTPRETKDGLYWDECWSTPKKEAILDDPPLDEILLYRVKGKVRPSDSFWVADVFYSPSPVQEKKEERPYYPLVFLLIDGDSGIIMNCQLFQNTCSIEEIRTSFLNTLESTGLTPDLLLLEREEVRSIFQPLAEKLGITIQVEEELAILEEVKENLFELFP